jgi:hypothetical protein
MWLWRQRKRAGFQMNIAKSIPQGLKPSLILLAHLPGLKPRPTSPGLPPERVVPQPVWLMGYALWAFCLDSALFPQHPKSKSQFALAGGAVPRPRPRPRGRPGAPVPRYPAAPFQYGPEFDSLRRRCGNADYDLTLFLRPGSFSQFLIVGIHRIPHHRRQHR